MNTKLTLKLDEAVIQSAKRYAEAHQTSLSKLTESYFRGIVSSAQPDLSTLPGVVGELSGILRNADVDSSKADYVDYLEDKYK